MQRNSPWLNIFAPWKAAPAPTSVIRRHFISDITKFWYKDVVEEESEHNDLNANSDEEYDHHDDAKSTSDSTSISVDLVVNGHRAPREPDRRDDKARESSMSRSQSKSYLRGKRRPFDLKLNSGGTANKGTALRKVYSGLFC